jgi:hypothetical protein
LYESEILRTSIFLVALLAEPLVCLIHVSVWRSTSTDMGVADPTLLMIPAVPLHMGGYVAISKLAAGLGPAMSVADSKVLRIRRYEPGALPGWCLQDHVDVKELPRTGKPWDNAAHLNQLALNPQRGRKDRTPRCTLKFEKLDRPLGIAAVQKGRTYIDPCQVAEVPPESQFIRTDGDFFYRESRQVFQVHLDCCCPPNVSE